VFINGKFYYNLKKMAYLKIENIWIGEP